MTLSQRDGSSTGSVFQKRRREFTSRPNTVFANAQVCLVLKSERICRQGDEPTQIFFVDDGLFKLSRLISTGHEVALGLSSAGSVVGIEAAITGAPYAFDGIALTNSRVLSVPATLFRDEVERNNEFAQTVLQLQSEQCVEQFEELVARHSSAAGRLSRFLVRTSPQMPASGPLSINLRFSHRELASLVGITPEHLSRTLAALEHERVLKREGARLVVRNPAALRAHCRDTIADILR